MRSVPDMARKKAYRSSRGIARKRAARRLASVPALLAALAVLGAAAAPHKCASSFVRSAADMPRINSCRSVRGRVRKCATMLFRSPVPAPLLAASGAPRTDGRESSSDLLVPESTDVLDAH